MTVTDPRGDPSLLQAVIEVEHRGLQQTLTEARRDTRTPGVHEQLLRHLQTALAQHLNAEIAVVHPQAEAALQDNDRGALADDTSGLRQLLSRSPAEWDLDLVDDALRAHIETVDAVLAELRAAVGGQHMAALGEQFGRALEGASARLV